MVVQPGGEGAGEADVLEQTSPCLPHLPSLEAASHLVEGQRCQQGFYTWACCLIQTFWKLVMCSTNLILVFL